MNLSRRRFLSSLFAAGAAVASTDAFGAMNFFEPQQLGNPLASYPNRDWERVYRNIFQHDSTFTFLCAPNDTHNCLLKTYVKNGVAVRIGPSYGYGKATDQDGNGASHRWDPRLCQKGLGLVRRVYGDRRLKAPMVRTGFKAWVDADFPRDPVTGRPDAKYFQRGKDSWQRVTWDEAYDISARAQLNITTTYSGAAGAALLHKQGYDEAMIEAMEGAGTQTLKHRGGMAFLGATRIYGMYRYGNMLALLDAKVRKVGEHEAHGARGWDSYSWHTDLPPGHAMVTGMQTNDFDLYSTEYSKLILVWGMNWITTKMPDSHWLTEARLKGARTVAITVEYSATASKCDEVVVLRPGTDTAYALSMAQVIMDEKLYDADWVGRNTDLPLLVRMDTLQPLRPSEVIAGYKTVAPKNLTVLKAGEKAPRMLEHREQYAPESLAQAFQPGVGLVGGEAVAITRDDWGKHLTQALDLDVDREMTLIDGTTVRVRSGFNLQKAYLDENFTPAQTEQITWAPESATRGLARQIAANPEGTLFATGMGTNQFFHGDLKDRAIFLVASLTRNVGFVGGNVGSYSGNYRSALFNGEPFYTDENPFNLQLDPAGKVEIRKYLHYESLHYFNYGDRPLRSGNKLLTGSGHIPTPTKSMWLNNSNSVVGNIKWHFDLVNNTLPKVEFVAFADWWWTGSCEYADVVYAVDSWAETKQPDMCGSCTNPFVHIYPRTPLKRIYDTKPDIEVIAGVANRLGELIEEPRMRDMWKFVHEDKVHVYLQRIIDESYTLAGYKIEDLEAKAAQGIPALTQTRTTPRVSSWEQTHGEMPWYTKSGRLEFYRPEEEFIESGENMVIYREPVDSTPYEPNVIVAHPHPAIRPMSPEEMGTVSSDVSSEARQSRHVILTPDQLLLSKHPLKLKLYTHVYHTPKYRHGAHTTPVDTDFVGVWFGPFGDVYRRDKRSPSVTEGYVDLNPQDCKDLGIEDGDYIYIDADPEDRPFRGWQSRPEEAKVARVLLRARYYPGAPRGIARTWHNMYGATFGSVEAHESREDGLAKSAETGYQAMYRYGSHQSATRAWLKPTLMTNSLIHKDMFGQTIGAGFAPDIHCPVGAPREAYVKIVKAEDGGLEGRGLWRPVTLGLRPTYESATMKDYLAGNFIYLRH